MATRTLKSFSATCEVWVKPPYKKSHPKNLTTAWCAESYEEMLGLLKVFYEGKRWKLMDWKELTNEQTDYGKGPERDTLKRCFVDPKVVKIGLGE